jgi:ketosteroid isomerase-like protein
VNARPKLDSVYLEFADAYRDLNLDAISDIYADDAFYLAPDRGILRGSPAITETFQEMFDAAREEGIDLKIRFHIVSRQVSGRMAVDVGTFVVDRSKDDAIQKTSTGKFIVVARRGYDDRWRFRVDGYSGLEPAARDQPATPAEEPPRPGH